MDKLNRLFSLKPLVLGLCALGFSATAMAATDADVKALRAEVAALKKEMREFKSDVKSAPVNHVQSVRKHGKKSRRADNIQVGSNVDLMKVSSDDAVLPSDYGIPGRSLVSTGPYVGSPIQFSGSNLIINSPSVNIDTQLLSIRKAILANIIKHHGAQAAENFNQGHLLLSGVVAGQAKYHQGAGVADGSDIDLSNMSLDAVVFGPSDWTQAFVELSYNNDYGYNDVYGNVANGHRVGNSRVYVNKAFITIGDFNKSPFYASVGQYYVPFGAYSSAMITDPLTKSLARTKARAITLGIQQQSENAFAGSVYAFQGDTKTNANGKRVSNGGIDASYKFATDGIKAKFGVGIIANLADSVGMQEGTNLWANKDNQRIDHRVPAYDVRGALSIGDHLDLLAEWVGASKRFDALDLSYGDHGAKPWALHTEADYSFYILNEKPSAFGIAYGKTSDALGLGLPSDRYSAVFNTSLWRNTLQAIEFRHENNYSKSSTATSGRVTRAVANGLGKTDNAVVAEFDYYF